MRWLNALLPPACPACEGPLPGDSAVVCPRCAPRLPTIAQACPRCADAVPALAVPDQPCAACLQRPPASDRAVAALRYDAPVDGWISGLKYRGELRQVHPLAQALIQRCGPLPRPDVLLPMPLHDRKLRARGFNQCIELARPVARALGLDWRSDWTRRVRHTPPHRGQDAAARRRNVRGAFTADPAVAGRHVAVLDDVMTTGATADELARTLRRAGAAEVSVWVVARAVREA